MIRMLLLTTLCCFTDLLAQNSTRRDGFIGRGNSTFPATDLNPDLDGVRFELAVNYNLNANARVMFGVHGGPKAPLEQGG